ncbi:HAD hydrolase-like protein, partial [Pseudomonas sp. Bout1]
PASTLMIGDRKHDLIGARSNGLDSCYGGDGDGASSVLSAALR